jgi:hypothetical protein
MRLAARNASPNSVSDPSAPAEPFPPLLTEVGRGRGVGTSNRRLSDAQILTERQYLVPMYQHIVVEAETFEAACQLAMADDISWNSQEMDCHSARATTLPAAKAIPHSYEVDPAQQVLITGSESSGIAPASFLYGSEAETGLHLEIPTRFADSE